MLKAKPRIERLAKHHDRESFSCGVKELDAYIRRQASQDARRKVARVFVATLEDRKAVAGYYTLSAASVELAKLPARIRRKLLFIYGSWTWLKRSSRKREYT